MPDLAVFIIGGLPALQMLEVVTADAEGLAASVNGTKELSERVSSKVRELDAAQVRQLKKLIPSMTSH